MDILKQLGIEENNFGACAGPGHYGRICKIKKSYKKI